MVDKARILVIEDESSQRELLKHILSSMGHAVIEAENGREGIESFKNELIDVVLLDYKLPDISGIDVLKELQSINSTIPVIMITAFQDVKLVVEAMKSGAFYYVVKPVNIEELSLLIKRALNTLNLQREVSRLRSLITPEIEFKDIVAQSRAMKEVISLAMRSAASDANVLITGESGTGKEVIARLIHSMSKRKDHTFVPVNLAAIPESLIESELFGYKTGAFTGADRDKMGYIELAEGGTLFLDEIGETPPMVQVKLLRVIQEKKFSKLGDPRERKCNVRFIFATNKDLRKLVEEGKFREDLYYRINVINIHIPPLRERREDIPYLLDHFLDKYCSRERKKVKGFTREPLNCSCDMTTRAMSGSLRTSSNELAS